MSYIVFAFFVLGTTCFLASKAQQEQASYFATDPSLKARAEWAQHTVKFLRIFAVGCGTAAALLFCNF